MGSPKQLLDLRGEPMLLAAVRPLLAAGLAGVLVVTQRGIAERIGAGLPAGVGVAFNDDPWSEMIDSVRIGMRTWRERETLRESDGFLVCPADQPGISAGDIETCRRAFERAAERIVIAEYQGKRGHPVIFPLAMAGFVESAACDKGLNALPRAFPERVLVAPCKSAGVTRDVDVPEDWRRVSEDGAD